jgi:hypothetical protein
MRPAPTARFLPRPRDLVLRHAASSAIVVATVLLIWM